MIKNWKDTHKNFLHETTTECKNVIKSDYKLILNLKCIHNYINKFYFIARQCETKKEKLKLSRFFKIKLIKINNQISNKGEIGVEQNKSV
jgi:hypothetical protein